MNNNLEEKIISSFKKITPNDFNSIVKDCEKNEGGIIAMSESSKKFNVKKWVSAAAVLVVAVLAVSGLSLSYTAKLEAARVYLDVNPSVEFSVNKNNKVIKAEAANDDGESILKDMSLKNTDLDDALDAVVGEMIKNGYISNDANSILVTVNGKKADTLKANVTEEVAKIIGSKGIDGAVLIQDLPKEDKSQDILDLAEKYGLSESKAKYIIDFAEANPKYEVEDLVGLTINELNLLSQNGGNKTEGTESNGTASDGKYIGMSKAGSVALEHLNTSLEEVKFFKVEMDLETVNGQSKMVYEVEFILGDTEYDIDIDSETGAVIKVKDEPAEPEDLLDLDKDDSDDKDDVDDDIDDTDDVDDIDDDDDIDDTDDDDDIDDDDVELDDDDD